MTFFIDEVLFVTSTYLLMLSGIVFEGFPFLQGCRYLTNLSEQFWSMCCKVCEPYDRVDSSLCRGRHLQLGIVLRSTVLTPNYMWIILKLSSAGLATNQTISPCRSRLCYIVASVTSGLGRQYSYRIPTKHMGKGFLNMMTQLVCRKGKLINSFSISNCHLMYKIVQTKELSWLHSDYLLDMMRAIRMISLECLYLKSRPWSHDDTTNFFSV